MLLVSDVFCTAEWEGTTAHILKHIHTSVCLVEKSLEEVVRISIYCFVNQVLSCVIPNFCTMNGEINP